MRSTSDGAGTSGSIWHRSTSLSELMSCNGPAPRVLSPKEAKNVVRKWATVCANGEPARFARRLAWDGWPAAGLAANIAKGRDAAAQPGRWLSVVESIIDSAESNRSTWARGAVERGEGDEPFEPFYWPMLAVASRLLTRKAGRLLYFLHDDALLQLEATLRRWLSIVCSVTLHRIFADCKSQGTALTYAEFVEQLFTGNTYRSVLTDYPVLSRLCAQAILDWHENVTELLRRFDRDRLGISARFFDGVDTGTITGAIAGVSDRHRGGRTVILLSLSNGQRLVYKPRPVTGERVFEQLVDRINASGPSPGLRCARVLARHGYGWQQYIETVDCDSEQQVRTYYRRLGMLIALSHALRCNDLHNENVIANGPYPVLIDMETIGQPVPMSEESDSPARSRYSVRSIGILPDRKITLDGKSIDVSVLGGFGPYQAEYQLPTWSESNTDTMRLTFASPDVPASRCLPMLDGKLAEPWGFEDELVSGFMRMGKWIIQERTGAMAPELISSLLRRHSTRVIIRPTQLYSLALYRSMHPEFLSSGVEFGVQLDVFSRPWTASSERPSIWALRASETADLERADIPHFTIPCSSRWMRTADGERLRFARWSGLEHVVSGLRNLDDDRLLQEAGIIRSLIRSHAPPAKWSTPKTRTASPQDPRETVSRIVDDLVAGAVPLGKQGFTWNSFLLDAGTQCYKPQLLDAGLYQGRAGVALFLSAVGVMCRNKTAQHMSRSVLASLAMNESEWDAGIGIGGATGEAGIAYALIASGSIMGRDDLVIAAKRRLLAVPPDVVDADDRFDLMSGTAGFLAALTCLPAPMVCEEVRRRAVHAGRHLVSASRRAAGRLTGWVTLPGTPDRFLSGMSHGLSGIGMSLRRAGELFNEPSFVRLASESFDLEDTYFDHSTGNWRMHRDARDLGAGEPRQQCSWCHGAPGIAMARLPRQMRTTEMRSTAAENAVIATIRAVLEESPLDHLCCGTLGRLAILHDAAVAWEDKALLRFTRRHLRLATGLARSRGHWRLCGSSDSPFWNVGLYQGSSGIGYELMRVGLRMALPSVLAWQPAPLTRRVDTR